MDINTIDIIALHIIEKYNKYCKLRLCQLEDFSPRFPKNENWSINMQCVILRQVYMCMTIKDSILTTSLYGSGQTKYGLEINEKKKWDLANPKVDCDQIVRWFQRQMLNVARCCCPSLKLKLKDICYPLNKPFKRSKHA